MESEEKSFWFHLSMTSLFICFLALALAQGVTMLVALNSFVLALNIVGLVIAVRNLPMKE